MIVFKSFLKVLNKCRIPIIIYTVFLIAFAGLQLNTSDNSTNFTASKPDVLVINKDEDVGVTKNLIEYIKTNCNIKDIKNNEEAINDALFYRDVNYIIYIPENYRTDFLNGLNPEIQIKSTGDYQSSYAEMLLTRYMKVADVYQKNISDEQKLIQNINNTFSKQAQVELTTKLDTSALSKVSFYYNFANYSILAGCVYVICLVLSSFKKENIRKRTIVSSMKYNDYNKILLLSNLLFALTLWLFYVIISVILLGNIMFTSHGMAYILNSFVFTICALTIAFLIGNLVINKNAINGIVNVIALGSSFLCGAFVPIEFLPESVLKVAHILPSYWYIQSNELLSKLEIINLNTLKPIFINMGVMLLFSVIFIIITNVISKNKLKID